MPEIAAAARANGLDFLLLTDHDTLAAASTARRAGTARCWCWSARRCRPTARNHYLAFGLSEPIDHRGMTPAQIVARVNEAGGFGFLAHPFSRGSERFRRGGQGMPWGDLEADGYTGIELWSFVTDTAERVNSIRDMFRFVADARSGSSTTLRSATWTSGTGSARRRRCVGARRRRRAPDRDPRRRPRAAAADGVQALVPLSAHAPAGGRSRCGTSSSADRTAVFAALRAGHAYIAMDSLAPARGFRFWAEGDGAALTMGDEAPAGDWTLRVRAARTGALRLLRDGAEVATANGTSLEHRAEGPASTASRPTASARPRAHLDPLEPDLPALSSTDPTFPGPARKSRHVAGRRATPSASTARASAARRTACAASAAVVASPTAFVIWRTNCERTSPAAKMPGTAVPIAWSVTMWPVSSSSIRLARSASKMSECGVNPTNGKIAFTFSSERSSVVDVAQRQVRDLAVRAVDLLDDLVQDLVDLAGRAHLLDQDRLRAVVVAAVDQVDLAPVAGQEGALLDGRVAAADDRDVRALEEGAVADRAVGDALAGQLLLAGDAELARLAAGRDDHRRGAELLAVRRAHHAVVAVGRDRGRPRRSRTWRRTSRACFCILSARSGPMMCSKPG